MKRTLPSALALVVLVSLLLYVGGGGGYSHSFSASPKAPSPSSRPVPIAAVAPPRVNATPEAPRPQTAVPVQSLTASPAPDIVNAVERRKIASGSVAARLADAQIVSTETRTLPHGQARRYNLLKTDFKYPNMVFEGDVPHGNPAAPDLDLENQVARLADHLLVSAAPGTDEIDFRAAIRSAGGEVLKRITPQGPYMVRLPAATIDAVPTAVNALAGDPRIGVAEPDYLVFTSDLTLDKQVLQEIQGVLINPVSQTPFNANQSSTNAINPSELNLEAEQEQNLAALPPEARILCFDKPYFYGGWGSFYPNTEEQNFLIKNRASILTDFYTTAISVSNGTLYNKIVTNSDWTLEHREGLTFKLLSIDLGEYGTSNKGSRGIVFTGHKADGSTVSQGFTTDGICDGNGPLQDFETFLFGSNFENLVKVTTSQSSFCLDNIGVVVEGQEATPVPPPAPPQIYDVNWSAGRHTVNALTGVGGDYAPTYYEGDSVYVRSSIGSMTGPALELTGTGAPFQGVSFAINRDTPAYRLEFDTYLDYTNGYLNVHFNGPGDVQKLEFFPDGRVNFFQNGTPVKNTPLGTYSLRTVRKVVMELDLIAATWKCLIDGAVVGSGPFQVLGRDLGSIRFVAVLPGGNKVGLDNVKIFAQGSDTRPMVGPRIWISSLDLKYGMLTYGSSKTFNLRVDNTGYEPLNITSLSTTHPAFTLPGSSPRTLAPGGSFLMPVTFTPTTAGAFSAKIQLASNDPARPIAEVPVSGSCEAGPTATLTPSELDVTMLANTIGTKTFGLFNTGSGSLKWSLILKPATTGATLPPPVHPNDSFYTSQWALREPAFSVGGIDAPHAWAAQTGSSSTMVAVIDTGVDYGHQDLSANIAINAGEIAGNGVDDDGNGYIDDVRGFDFAYDDPLPSDIYGHGTHVAGIIAAHGNNNKGVTGVSWATKILPVKFLNDQGKGTTSDAIAAIHYANVRGAKIKNNSWGGGGYSTLLYNEIEAAGASGALFVAAAGNYSSNNDVTPHYPASYNLDCIVSVASSTQMDDLSYFSNYGGASVDLAAPGSGILSTYPGNLYATNSGTSMATPFVSGAAALLQSANPSTRHAELKNLLLLGVDEVGAFAGRMVSNGRLNAYKSLGSIVPQWLQLQVSSGSLGAGASVPVPLTVDTSYLTVGTYEKWITLISNDALRPKIDLRVKLNVVPNDSYSRWVSGSYGIGSMLANSTAASLWGSSADPNGNGIPNALEFILATDTGPGAIPYSIVPGDPSTFEFQVRDNLQGAGYVVEWASDLSQTTWNTTGYTVVLNTTSGMPPGLRRIRVKLNGAAPDSVYFRLAATASL